MRLFYIQILIFTFGLTTSKANGDVNQPSIYDLPKAVAIQPRKYDLQQSLLGTIGYIPTDSFNRGYTFTAAYRYGFANTFVWEVFSFTYVLNQATQLKDQIEGIAQGSSQVQIQNVGLGGVLDYPRQIYMTGIHYSPIYSKNLLFNSKLSYSEFSLFLGTGSLNFNSTGYKPMIAPGLAARFYISPDYSVAGLTGIMDFGIGFEMRFGGDKKSRTQDRPVGEMREEN